MRSDRLAYWQPSHAGHPPDPCCVVDIVPQAKRLRLSLTMPFAELDDPRGIAKNVAGVGRWGHGEVELGISSLEEVRYSLGLIRQSLERQPDDTAEAPCPHPIACARFGNGRSALQSAL